MGPPGRHIYPHADVAQYRGVDTCQSCNPECDAPPFGCWFAVDQPPITSHARIFEAVFDDETKIHPEGRRIPR
jgi:hypothetical protein